MDRRIIEQCHDLCEIRQSGLVAACVVARLSSFFRCKTRFLHPRTVRKITAQLSIPSPPQFTQYSDMPDTQLPFRSMRLFNVS
jgi:hypothetical protein